MKPRVCMVGKICVNDWRHSLVSNLRGHLWADGDIETNDFIYVGPYFVSCDPGCFRGEGSHGTNGECWGGTAADFSKQEVFQNNNKRSHSADLVFAYITGMDCCGALVDIGCASERGIRIIIAYAPGVEVDGFTYVSKLADVVYNDISADGLKEILDVHVQISKIIAFCDGRLAV